MHACWPSVLSHPWALRPTALKVRRSHRPSVRVREGRGPAGQGFQKVSVGKHPSGCPRPAVPSTGDDDNRREREPAVCVPLDGTAEMPPEGSPGPILQTVCKLGRGCGEIQLVSKSVSLVVCLRRGSHRRRDTCPFPVIIIAIAMAVDSRHSKYSSPHSQVTGRGQSTKERGRRSNQNPQAGRCLRR